MGGNTIHVFMIIMGGNWCCFGGCLGMDKGMGRLLCLGIIGVMVSALFKVHTILLFGDENKNYCADDESHLCFLESNYVREMHRRRTNFGILPFAYCPRTVRMLGIVIDCPAKVKDKLLHTVVQTGRTYLD